MHRIDRIKAIAIQGCASIPTGDSLLIKFAARLTVCLALTSLCTSLSVAQQPTPSSSPDSSAQSQPNAPAQDQKPASAEQTPAQPAPPDTDKKNDNAGEQGKQAGTSNDRLFKVLPNFLTLETAGKLPPLTAKQKFAVVARGTFDPVQFPWWGLLAAISQADNSEPAYGQGWDAYAKRYGTTAADSIIENFMTQAVFASVLRQDPRFYQSSKGGFARRSWYAVSRIFVTRTDSGHAQFNYSEIVGAATAAAVSTYSYHPTSTYLSTPTNPHMFIPSDRTLLNTANVWGTQIALDTFTIFLKEFWPDVRRKMSRKHPAQTKSTASEPATP
jgi:hypothetical protein